jgi:hypothetical protein
VTRPRFAEWYYGGPFVAVGNPDADLPQRSSGAPIPESTRRHVETEGRVEGERIVAPFRDGNTIEHILSEIQAATGYPNEWPEEDRTVYPTIQGALARIADRLQEKASRSRRQKAAWLHEALLAIRAAAAAYSASDYRAGGSSLREAEDLVQGASRAGRRAIPIQLPSGERADGGE